MKTKAASFARESVFAGSLLQTPDMIRQHHLPGRIADWFDQGKIRWTSSEFLSRINAESRRATHRTLEGGRSIGKIV
ncbi:hypothetical protein [Planctomycetes bacterium K23_9]|uniref:Zinc-type alcohol dehydrogenase-like protein n=1 Tax=Stieleria marina TaxID=1930275 RepID=A0A517NRN8_9BACT|nr:Zinc-type alcohol dehydrogenase-like protein [Planctomycetes bacterium K23_9]